MRREKRKKRQSFLVVEEDGKTREGLKLKNMNNCRMFGKGDSIYLAHFLKVPKSKGSNSALG